MTTKPIADGKAPGEKRVNHLLNCRAFTKANLGFPCENDDALRTHAAQLLKDWTEERVKMQTVRVNIGKHTLKKTASNEELHSITNFPVTLRKFRYIQSSDSPVQILDPTGFLLGYKFKIKDVSHVEKLEKSDILLPARKLEKHVQGEYVLRQYSLSRDSANNFHYSKDYLDEQKEADFWLDKNKELFSYLSNSVLRMLDPEMFVKLTNWRAHPKHPGLGPLAGAWAGVAIISYGAFEGEDLVLWQLKLKVKISPGEAFLFHSATIAHSITEVTGGERKSIDLLIHKSHFEGHGERKEFYAEKKKKLPTSEKHAVKRLELKKKVQKLQKIKKEPGEQQQLQRIKKEPGEQERYWLFFADTAANVK
ncbi:hypothetical protein RUND412_007582 [Rhizina undulata]